MNKGVFIFSAPSGSGKTTILKPILEKLKDKFGFSISATTRPAREGEKDEVDYYFITPEKMREHIANGDFLEWEEVYPGKYYGTYKAELDRIWQQGKYVIFDIDVKGGVNIKNILKNQACSIFIMPPSIEELERRLRNRNTESEETLKERLLRAEMEISLSENFDFVVCNDDLDEAIAKVEEIITQQMNNWSV
ncbi:MAG: guanylate kinase [Bacteroidales bacterium]|jgi:guanylate kinase|nr:guanylate kinase [Bacteroidales bacterium]MBQ5872759.1 guanylate kinase [Bacteroidales bacterium]